MGLFFTHEYGRAYTFFFNLLLLLKQREKHIQLLEELACCRASTTAQQSAISHPCTKHRSTYVPIRVRQRKHADRGGECQHVAEHLSAARCVLKTKEEIKIHPAKKMHNHKQLAGDARRICPFYFFCQSQYLRYNTLLPVRYLFV